MKEKRKKINELEIKNNSKWMFFYNRMKNDEPIKIKIDQTKKELSFHIKQFKGGTQINATFNEKENCFSGKYTTNTEDSIFNIEQSSICKKIKLTLSEDNEELLGEPEGFQNNEKWLFKLKE
tara:strand:+ start:1063 stop:1428 length:366 start_codon:yes stop_codon:yes gene_type:complete